MKAIASDTVLATRSFTLHDQFELTRRRSSGFDFMRLGLALAVVAFHALLVCGGTPTFNMIFDGQLRPFAMFLLPSFFALSGFLVAGSLERNTLPTFFILRAIRIVPALAVEVLLSAFIIGPLFTTRDLGDYFTDPQFWAYFGNMVGWVHFHLPGVFLDLPLDANVNGQLWTIPYELDCYLMIGALSLFGVALRVRRLLTVTVFVVLALTAVQVLSLSPYPRMGLTPGRLLIASTLGGVLMYVARRHIPFNRGLACLAIALSWFFLSTTNFVYLAAVPVAYVTVFIGLHNPRRWALIESGDYSYAIYLYSFPIQQALVEMFPHQRYWLFNAIAGLAITSFCAYLSWHLVEVKVLGYRKMLVAMVEAGVAQVQDAVRQLRRERR